MNTAPLACLTIALMVLGGAAAQTERRSTQIWRCGPEGRELRDAPCPAAPQASGRRLEYDSPRRAPARAGPRDRAARCPAGSRAAAGAPAL